MTKQSQCQLPSPTVVVLHCAWKSQVIIAAFLIGLFTSPPNYSPLRFEKRLAKLNLGHDCRRSTEDGSSLASLEFAVGGQIKAKPGNHRIHGRGHQDVVASGQCSKITTGTPIKSKQYVLYDRNELSTWGCQCQGMKGLSRICQHMKGLLRYERFV